MPEESPVMTAMRAVQSELDENTIDPKSSVNYIRSSDREAVKNSLGQEAHSGGANLVT